MAITKIIAIRDRLDKRVNYVVNSEKTSLDAGILYAANPEKTEQSFFTDVLNCENVQTAYDEMADTKKRWNKTGGVLGYHFIQSFAPGEVTPEQAHRIGVEFARELFGNRYEVVIGTHLDKAHLHNHIIVNSVSFRDGSKYHSSHGSYFFQVRKTSDELCRENELSIVEPKGKGRNYGEWRADQQGKPTIRGIIRDDIDTLIAQAYTYQSLLMLLERQGYMVKHGPNRKYTTVQPPGAKRAIRLDSLGEGYTEEAIKQRLAAQRSGEKNISANYHAPLPVKHYRLRGRISAIQKKKITGFLALYFRYVYMLRGLRQRKKVRRVSFPVRQEVIRLERYQTQFRYLYTNHITTAAELEQQISRLEWDIHQQTEKRKPLYQERRNTIDEEAKERCSREIDRQTAALRQLRRELALCRRIQEDIPQVSQQVQQVREEKMRKEEPQHEYQRRNR